MGGSRWRSEERAAVSLPIIVRFKLAGGRRFLTTPVMLLRTLSAASSHLWHGSVVWPREVAHKLRGPTHAVDARWPHNGSRFHVVDVHPQKVEVGERRPRDGAFAHTTSALPFLPTANASNSGITVRHGLMGTGKLYWRRPHRPPNKRDLDPPKSVAGCRGHPRVDVRVLGNRPDAGESEPRR